jgi:hypothetical protein
MEQAAVPLKAFFRGQAEIGLRLNALPERGVE